MPAILPAVVGGASGLLKLLSALWGVDLVQSLVTGKSLTSVLGREGDVEEHQKRQAEEVFKARRNEQMAADRQAFAAGLAPKADDLMTVGALLQSGMFNEDLVRSESENLVGFVARELGTTPEDLASRTRPTMPFDLMRGR